MSASVYADVILPSLLPSIDRDQPDYSKLGVETINLVYVAVTRAKKCLILTHTLKQIMMEAKVCVWEGGGIQVCA